MWPTGYDQIFKKFTDLYFGEQDVDWLWFKAQGIAESGLNKLAVSPVGAKGIMQLMPGTFKAMGINGDINNPIVNIEAGIAYDRRMWDCWFAKRSFNDRLNLMFASYNAGLGNILKAQERASDKVTWEGISIELKWITGKHSKETIGYVNNIHKYYRAIKSSNAP
jgi:membrane-bound lytic murein transglycosylase F